MIWWSCFCLHARLPFQSYSSKLLKPTGLGGIGAVLINIRIMIFRIESNFISLSHSSLKMNSCNLIIIVIIIINGFHIGSCSRWLGYFYIVWNLLMERSECGSKFVPLIMITDDHLQHHCLLRFLVLNELEGHWLISEIVFQTTIADYSHE